MYGKHMNQFWSNVDKKEIYTLYYILLKYNLMYEVTRIASHINNMGVSKETLSGLV